MKNFSVVLLILALGTPVFADIINPYIPKDKYYKVKVDKKVYKQRRDFVKRVCGPNFKEDKDCKYKLQSEMRELENFINGR